MRLFIWYAVLTSLNYRYQLKYFLLVYVFSSFASVFCYRLNQTAPKTTWKGRRERGPFAAVMQRNPPPASSRKRSRKCTTTFLHEHFGCDFKRSTFEAYCSCYFKDQTSSNILRKKRCYHFTEIIEHARRVYKIERLRPKNSPLLPSGLLHLTEQ